VSYLPHESAVPDLAIWLASSRSWRRPLPSRVHFYPTCFHPSHLTENPTLLGNWYQEYEYHDRDFIVHLQGTIQYFSNKKYRVTGELKATRSGPGLPSVVYFDYDGNGEWQATDAELVIKALNVKAPASRIETNGKTVLVSEIKLPPDSPLMDLGPKIMLAQSQ
jgi:hypothetical protein